MARWNVLLPLAVFFTLPTGQALAGEPSPKHSARIDHYGDPLPDGVRFRLGSVRLRHVGPVVTSLAWSRDARTLMTAGGDHTVRLWQIPGGKPLAKWDKMASVEFSPDGRILACGGNEGPIRIHDVATGKELRRMTVPKAGVYPEAFSPDGKMLAAIQFESPRGVHLYATDSGKEIRFLEGPVMPTGQALGFAPDGRTLIGATEGGVYRWTIDTGKKSQLPWDYESFPVIWCIAFSPDGKTLAAAIGDGIHNLITLRSWPSGKELRRLDAKDFDPEKLAFSPDGKFLAAFGMGRLRLWDPAAGKELRRFEGNDTDVIALAFSPDGSLLASAGKNGAAAVWEVQAKKAPRPLTGVGHRISAVAMTADGRTLLTHARDGVLTLWDGREGRRLRTLVHWRGGIQDLLLSPDGSRAAALPELDYPLLYWDVASGRRLPEFSGIEKRINCAAFSPDSAMLALGGADCVSLREAENGKEMRRLKERDSSSVANVTFSPDGRTLAAAYFDGRLTLWDRNSNRPRHRLSGPRRKHIWKLAFSFDSRLLAVLRHGERLIRLYETASGQEIEPLRVNSVSIGSLAFAADNRTLATGDTTPDKGTGGVSESAIRLWDVPTRKPIRVLRGHQGDVHTLVFSADGTSLISGSEDNTVLSWDVAAAARRRPAGKELSAARLAQLWSDLAATDAARAQRAVAELIEAPDVALPFLEKTLPPTSPAEMSHIAALIADLDSEQFARRANASRGLEKIGAPAAPALRKALKDKPSLEMRKRIAAILETIDERPISPQWLRTLRAVQVLESIGTVKTKKILEGLSRGADAAALTQEAKAALKRLAQRNVKR